MSKTVILIASALMSLLEGCSSTVFRVLSCERIAIKGVVSSLEEGTPINQPRPLSEVLVSYLNVRQLPKTGVEYTNDSGEFINRFIPRKEVWRTNQQGEFMGLVCPDRDGEPSDAMLGFEKQGYKARLIPVLSGESQGKTTVQSCVVRAPGDCLEFSVVMQRKE